MPWAWLPPLLSWLAPPQARAGHTLEAELSFVQKLALHHNSMLDLCCNMLHVQSHSWPNQPLLHKGVLHGQQHLCLWLEPVVGWPRCDAAVIGGDPLQSAVDVIIVCLHPTQGLRCGCHCGFHGSSNRPHCMLATSGGNVSFL